MNIRTKATRSLSTTETDFLLPSGQSRCHTFPTATLTGQGSESRLESLLLALRGAFSSLQYHTAEHRSPVAIRDSGK